MYILYGLKCEESESWGRWTYENRREPLARFSTNELAERYAANAVLEQFPNGNARFKRSSLLGCYTSYEIEKEEEASLPINPVPSGTKRYEYIVVVPEPGCPKSFYRVLCRTKEEADKELKLFGRAAGTGIIEEREI